MECGGLTPQLCAKMKKLKRKTVLITAGPTREYIDPVRFISNASSGKMGYALAQEAKRLGARVILVSGPTNLNPPRGVRFIPVISALQMKKQVDKVFPKADYVISTAAVSDYRPAKKSKKKIKKTSKYLNLKLIQNPDILESLGRKKTKQKLIGFALETGNIVREARKKLKQKNLDLIFANSISNIQSNQAQGYIIGKKVTKLPIMSKPTFACFLWKIILSNS